MNVRYCLCVPCGRKFKTIVNDYAKVTCGCSMRKILDVVSDTGDLVQVGQRESAPVGAFDNRVLLNE